jgi:hypothetical protein
MSAELEHWELQRREEHALSMRMETRRVVILTHENTWRKILIKSYLEGYPGLYIQ